jgi:Icc protein
MSDVLGRKVSRREFLSFGLAVAGGVITLKPRRARGTESPVPGNRKREARWALLSDIHIATSHKNHFHGHYPYRNLVKALGQITGDMPDGMVITGDLARWKGDTGAYNNVRAMLAPVAARRTIHLGLGNHDHRARFLSAFGVNGDHEEPVRNKYVVTGSAGPVRLIMLDSLLYTNVYGGLIGKTQRAWLDTYLRVCDDTPTILFLHHAPRADLLDAGRLLDIAGPARKVKAIVYGHSHRYDYREYEGIHLVNLPACGYNFTNAQPVGWVEAWLTDEGGEFTLHAVGGSRKRDGRPVSLAWRA